MKVVFLWLLLVSTLALEPRLELSSEAAPPTENCIKCQQYFGYLQAYLSDPSLYAGLRPLIIQLCVANLIPVVEECEGFLKTFEGTASTAAAEAILNYEKLCVQFEYCTSPHFVKENFDEWAWKVYSNLPSSPPVPKAPVDSTLTFVHLSDIHIDLQYVAGSDSICQNNICCRFGNGTVAPAGTWTGGHRCDLPPRTLDAALQQIASLNPAFIIMTGDIPPHSGWEYSEEFNLAHQKYVADAFKTYIPDSIPVFPIYGNHGSSPINQHKYANNPNDWQPTQFAALWGMSPEQTSQLENNAGYSMQYKESGLRLIALDTQTGNYENVWLLQNATNPKGIMTWLEQELAAAEASLEKVYIFGHVPFGSGTLTPYARHMNVLVERYQNTIAGIFFGHLHYDSWQVGSGHFSGKPTKAQWIAPSLTTGGVLHSSFRLFEIDSATYEVQNFYQYRLNQTKANENPDVTPTWDVAYDFKSQYGVEDMSAESIYNLSLKIGSNESVALDYIKNLGDPNADPNACDADCLLNIKCRMISAVYDDGSDCIGFPTGLFFKVIGLLYGDWTYKVYP